MTDPQEKNRYNALTRLGALIKIHNNGLHWEIWCDRRRADFWPTTERYRLHPFPTIYRGFDKLIQEIKRNQNDQSKDEAG